MVSVMTLLAHPMQTASNGTKTQIYYPSRPRSHSAGSSYTKLNGFKVITKAYCKTQSQEDERQRPMSGGITGRYKTELCRPYQDYGYCKYGDKCQFAHGEHEIREVPRHPKYKTELCRTYHSRGFCPYGPRCHFIHNLDEVKKLSEHTPKSPKKAVTTTLAFTLPISPSLDSGISSPAAEDMLGQNGSRVFEFPGSESSGSDDGDHDLEQFPCLLRRNHYSPLGDHIHQSFDTFEQREKLMSPDLYLEFDSLSVSSGSSPTKPPSDGFTSDRDLNLGALFEGISLQDVSSNGHRLPVFDDMLNSKSDTALISESPGGAPRFALFT